jgi:hypothetical protein
MGCWPPKTRPFMRRETVELWVMGPAPHPTNAKTAKESKGTAEGFREEEEKVAGAMIDRVYLIFHRPDVPSCTNCQCNCGLSRPHVTERGTENPLLQCQTECEAVQAARKPNFVLDDHSSRRRLAATLKQPTRRFRPLASLRKPALAASVVAARLPAYLVLLRVGFTVPLVLPPMRWALTPPFHPYLRSLTRSSRRSIFCCTGRLRALRRASRTLSGTLPCGVRTFLPLPTRRSGERRAGGSDRPAACTFSV